MIRIMQLSKSFGNKQVLDTISFEVPKGMICGFVGENGAGKSTTMRILATLDLEYTWSFQIAGLEGKKDIEHIRSKVWFMPDQYGLYDELTVYEYLEFFAMCYKVKNIPQAISRTLKRVHLEDKKKSLIKGLSRGMTQRICLAKAIIHDPDILILDEPASGLDPNLRIKLTELLLELKAEGKTILVSSHILSELWEYCDMVVFLHQGKILQKDNLGHDSQKQQSMSIMTDDNEAAGKILSKHPKRKTRKWVKGQRVVNYENGESNDILTALIWANIRIISVKPERDIEELYLQNIEA